MAVGYKHLQIQDAVILALRSIGELLCLHLALHSRIFSRIILLNTNRLHDRLRNICLCDKNRDTLTAAQLNA